MAFDFNEKKTDDSYRIEQPAPLINILAGRKKCCDISQGLPVVEGGVGHGALVSL